MSQYIRKRSLSDISPSGTLDNFVRSNFGVKTGIIGKQSLQKLRSILTNERISYKRTYEFWFYFSGTNIV